MCDHGNHILESRYRKGLKRARKDYLRTIDPMLRTHDSRIDELLRKYDAEIDGIEDDLDNAIDAAKERYSYGLFSISNKFENDIKVHKNRYRQRREGLELKLRRLLLARSMKLPGLCTVCGHNV